MTRIIIDRQITYDLDAGATRTLPAGWRGEVTDEVAERILAAGAGRVTDPPAEPAGAAKTAKPKRKPGRPAGARRRAATTGATDGTGEAAPPAAADGGGLPFGQD